MNPIENLKDDIEYFKDIIDELKNADNKYDINLVIASLEFRLSNLEWELNYYTDRKQKTIKCSSYYKEKSYE